MQDAKHPKHSRELKNVFDYGTGRGIRLDAAGEVAKPATEKYQIKKGFHCSRHNKINLRGRDIRALQMATGADVFGVNVRVRRGTGERNCAKDHTILSCAEKIAVLSLEKTCTFAMETSPVKL